jgi:hypothetical protein
MMRRCLAALLLLGPACRGERPATSRPSAAADATADASFEDWYPADVAPPSGTQYPCALTALPRDLPGIPPADRRFVNHTYSLLLKATRSKLILLTALPSVDGLPAALERYQGDVRDVEARLKGEPVPAGLEAFADDVRSALALQRGFFEAAVEQRIRGVSLDDVYQIREGRLASARLGSAWSHMQQRYPKWDDTVKDSIYHHLCALDLF